MTAADRFAQACAVPSPIAPLADWEFSALQKLIYEEAGILLGPAKKALLVARLTRRVRELGHSSFGAYYRRVTSSGQARELQVLLDCVCTNETHFFREPHHFDLLEQRIYPEWEASAKGGGRPREIRVWSAGCSTGEEPYSIAMSLLDRFPADQGWRISILASDLSTRVLKEAALGVFPRKRAQRISPQLMRAFMLKGVRDQDGFVKVSPEIASLIRFERRNLNDEPPPAEFDLVFCRNVLIYFAADTRARALKRLLGRLRPRGYLFLGHAENLHGLGGLEGHVRGVIPNVYQLVSDFAPTP